MSLINQMLQELDARHSEVNGVGQYAQQIRAVPERRQIHPAWWLVLLLAVVLVAMSAWIWLRPPTVGKGVDMRELPLKFDMGLSLPNAVQPAGVANRLSSPPAVSQPPSRSTEPDAAALNIALPQLDRTKKQRAEQTAVLATNSREASAAVQPDQPAPAAKTRVVAEAKAPEPAPPMQISKQVKELTPQQRAENEYRKAVSLMQQGRASDATASMEQALQLDPQHAAARQALIGMLLEVKRQDDALRTAREGLALDPAQPTLAMVLARVQLEKGELAAAIDTLQHSLPYASERADYRAFLGALLQREGKHKQATEQYLLALQRAPQNGVWWMGLGISYQAENRLPEALEAFKRAKASNTLTADLLAFVEGRISQVQR